MKFKPGSSYSEKFRQSSAEPKCCYEALTIQNSRLGEKSRSSPHPTLNRLAAPWSLRSRSRFCWSWRNLPRLGRDSCSPEARPCWLVWLWTGCKIKTWDLNNVFVDLNSLTRNLPLSDKMQSIASKIALTRKSQSKLEILFNGNSIYCVIDERINYQTTFSTLSNCELYFIRQNFCHVRWKRDHDLQ